MKKRREFESQRQRGMQFQCDQVLPNLATLTIFKSFETVFECLFSIYKTLLRFNSKN